jgi:diguanylate cyclase (GGDEF)-like protein
MTADISWKALLGLADPVGMEKSFVTDLQARSLRDSPFRRVSVNLLFAIIAISLYGRLAPAWASISWAVAFCGFHLYSFQIFRTKWDWKHAHLLPEDFRRINLHVICTAVLWGSSFFTLGLYGGLVEMIGLWSIILALMVYASMMLTMAPRAATAFIAITSICSSASFAGHEGWYLSIASLLIGFLLVNACLRFARSQILLEAASSVLQEKSDTVSLLLREFEDSGADWLWQTDTARCATHVSPRFAYALGEEAKIIEGQPLLKLIAGDAWEHGKYPAPLHDLADRLKKRESFSNLIVPVTLKGVTRWWELSASPRNGDDGSFLGFRGVGSDVTEQHESANKISHLARFDTLTGLPNRLQLTEALGSALTESEKWRRRCAFLMIDLDRFKAVNDTLGHPIGDRLLAQVAHRLHQIMTPNELCGRLGGDEFAVVIKEANDPKYVAQVAENIIKTLSRPYTVDQNTLYIGASVGSAIGPIDGRSVELLMRSSDLALYRSKEEGGNLHHSYQHKLHANAEERRLMEFELRNALDKNQLHVEYQSHAGWV